MQIDKKVSNIISQFLVIILLCITGYLFIVSLFSTVYISEYENVYYIKDNFIFNLLIIVFLSIVIFVLKDKISNLINGNEIKMVIFNTFVLSFFLLFFVLSTRLYPLYDQAKLLNVVKHMFVYDYSDFMKGGYISKCDNQKGIVLYFYFLTRLIGKISISLIQVINVIFIVIANIYIYKTFEIIFNKKIAAVIHLVICLYIPYNFYSTFIYGIVPSFSFGIVALYFFVKIIKNDDNKSLWDSILVGLFLSLAISFKTNSVIILIAVVVISLFYLIFSDNRIRFIFVIAFSIIFYLASVKIIDGAIYNISGYECKGIPRTAHIAMSLMENNEKAPGWYNGYVQDIYEETSYDREETDRIAKDSIKDSITGLKSSPSKLISFISRKIVSQWNDPTYESIFILFGRDSLNEMPKWLLRITDPTDYSNFVLREIMNIMQLIIIFGAFIYFLLYEKREYNIPIYGVVIIGGFFFHILWEAKSQYILTYFILLIPYSVKGYIEFINKIEKALYEHRNGISEKSILKKDVIKIASIIIVLLLVAVVPSENAIGKIFKPSWKNEEYKQITNTNFNEIKKAGRLDYTYQDSLNMPKLKRKKGYYEISLLTDENIVLSPVSDNNEEIDIIFCRKEKLQNVDNRVIIFNNEKDEAYIVFTQSYKVLDVNMANIAEGNYLQQWEYNGDEGQKFNLEKIGENTYYIVCEDLYIGIDDNNKPILVNKEDEKKVAVNIKLY